MSATDDVIAALDRGEVRVASPTATAGASTRTCRRRSSTTSACGRWSRRWSGPFAYHDKIPLKTNYEGLGVRVVPPADCALRRVPLARRRADAELRQHRRLRRAEHDGRHLGHGRLRRADRRERAPRGRRRHRRRARAAEARSRSSSRTARSSARAASSSKACASGARRCSRRTSRSPPASRSSTSPARSRVEHRGYVPPRSVVVPGTRPKEFPAGTYHLACALIIGTRSESTDLKTSLNDALREI